MGSIKLPHSGGNSMSLAAPSTNPSGDLELKLPATIGTAGQVLKNSDTAGTLEFGLPPRPYRNLIINGAMQVAQRGTSSTSGNYQTVDRFYPDWNGTDEAMTQAQVDVTADTDPWNLGFRKALKLTNGNQTSGAGAADDGYILYRLEAQDIANCGWDYTSTSSYITYSFWVKSSVAQTFYGVWSTHDGTSKAYPISFALSADTWTKVTGSIPGVSGLQFDNDNSHGLDLRIYTFLGTDKTASGVSLNTWANTNWSERTPDMTSTWWTTNDATFEITGLQLEVGDVATSFEHRSYGDELARCQRYYQKSYGDFSTSYSWKSGGYGRAAVNLCTMMRATPTVTATVTGGGGTMGTIVNGGAGTFYLTTSSLNEDQATTFSWTATAEL